MNEYSYANGERAFCCCSVVPYHLPDADRAERRTGGVLGEVVRLAVVGVPELLAPVDVPCEDQPATNRTLASISRCRGQR